MPCSSCGVPITDDRFPVKDGFPQLATDKESIKPKKTKKSFAKRDLPYADNIDLKNWLPTETKIYIAKGDLPQKEARDSVTSTTANDLE